MSEKTYQRIVLATEQLDVALELFLCRRSFVSALTLAGAAEEILGKALAHRGEAPWLKYEHGLVAEIEKILRGQPYKLKDFVDEKNRVRSFSETLQNICEICQSRS
jgi:hypothetical protein